MIFDIAARSLASEQCLYPSSNCLAIAPAAACPKWTPNVEF